MSPNSPLLLAAATGAAAVAMELVRRLRWRASRESRRFPGRPDAAAAALPASEAEDDRPPPVDLATLDCACPQLFYLPDPALEKLADCFACVEGVRLPLHQQVLAAQAAVLRQLFLAQAEGGFGGADAPGGSQAPVELSSAFAGCSVAPVAAFLRFLYSPDHATLASLRAVHAAGDGALLAAVARLAHRLDAAGLLRKIEAYLQAACVAAGIPELISTVQLAEGCHLVQLADACLSRLAGRLAAAGPFWSEQVSAAQLARCSSDSLAALACKMAGAVHAGAFEPPAVHGVKRGRRGAAGGFTWLVPCFSKQRGRITSPWVEVGGIEWRLKLWPRGDDGAGGTHLSAYLECNHAQAAGAGLASVLAHYEFTFLDQAEDGLHYVVDCGSDTFNAATQNWGKTRMMPLEELHRLDRAYLQRDRLAVRISIRVATPPPAAAAPPSHAPGAAA